MIDLDDAAETHLDRLSIPEGVGLNAVIRAGRRKRRLARTAAATGTLAFVGLAVAGLATVGNRTSTVDVATTPPTEQSADDASSPFFGALPDRDLTAAPPVPTPVVAGWAVERASLSIGSRFDGQILGALYLLRQNSTVVDVRVTSGNFGIPDTSSIQLDRPSGPIDAEIEESDGYTIVRWDERPGNNTGLAASVRGRNSEQVLEIAASVIFVDDGYSGGESPRLVDLDPDRQALLQGETDGSQWQISDHEGDVVIEIGGQSPTIEFISGSVGPLDVHLTSISNDGLQVHLVDMPLGATAATVVGGESFPAESVNHNNRTYAVVVIPSARDAFGIRVMSGDQSQIMPLPLAPHIGWSTQRIESDGN